MTTRSTAVALYCPVSANNNPFSEDYYWQAYQDFVLALQSRGVTVYLILDQDSYVANGRFKKAFQLQHKTSLEDLEPVEDVDVGIVFNRSDFMADDILIINDPKVQSIGTDKIKTYELFGRFQPRSFVCQNRDEVTTAFDQLEDSYVVVKKPVSYGGKDVYIGEKADVLKQIPSDYPLLVQEFLDTSEGVAGKMSGVHDVLLSMAGGELIGCYIRQAGPNSLHSNVSRGGKMIFMDVSETPAELKQAAEEVDKVFAEYPRYFSVDFISTNQGWKMLEINALLALLPRTDGPEAEYTLEKLADYFAALSYELRLSQNKQKAYV